MWPGRGHSGGGGAGTAAETRRRGCARLTSGEQAGAGAPPPPLLLVVVALMLAAGPAARVAAQGLRADADEGRMGANGVDTKVREQRARLYEQASLADAFNQARKRTQGQNCAARPGRCEARMQASGTDADARAALIVATAPSAYDARNASHTGGFNAAPLPAEQGYCESCVAHVLAAAARSAMAAALKRDAGALPLASAAQIFFCLAPGDGNDCYLGSSLRSGVVALTSLATRLQGIYTADCLPFPNADKLEAGAMVADICSSRNCDAKITDAAAKTEGVLSYTQASPLREYWQIQHHLRRNGAAVVTRMTVPQGFREWFSAPGRRTAIYDNPNATVALAVARSQGLNHAVVIAGYDNKAGAWLIWSPWGKDFADGGFARVKYGQLGIADPDYTIGLVFSPKDKPTPPPLPLRRDPGLPRGCLFYTTRVGDYVGRMAEELKISPEALLEANSMDRIPSVGEWLRPGTDVVACGLPLNETCGRYSTCGECEATGACSWCFEGLPPGSEQKPGCMSLSKACQRRVQSPAECPADGLKQAPPRAAGVPATTCSSLPNCRACLRFTYQCKWCVSQPPGGASQCGGADMPCAAWYGYSPRECPSDGDPGAVESRGRCSSLGDCGTCLSYGGASPQCVWCQSTGACLSGGDDAAARAACADLLTRGTSQCPSPPAKPAQQQQQQQQP